MSLSLLEPLGYKEYNNKRFSSSIWIKILFYTPFANNNYCKKVLAGVQSD